MEGPIDVVAGIILRGENLLLHQRETGDTLEGAWEFPGGKVEPGEDYKAALRREIKEEFNLEIDIRERIGEVIHRYPHIYIRLIAYLAFSEEGEVRCSEGDFHWVPPKRVERYVLCPADRRLWEQIRGEVELRADGKRLLHTDARTPQKYPS